MFCKPEMELSCRQFVSGWVTGVEFYIYPTVGTVLIHSVKPELTE